MDIRIEGEVTERRTNGHDISFIIKAGDNSYKLSNCQRGNTDQQTFEEGIECYRGNLDITEDCIVRTILATLWIEPNHNCVLIYPQ